MCGLVVIKVILSLTNYIYLAVNMRKIIKPRRKLIAVNGKIFILWKWIKPVQILLLGDYKTG